MENFNDKINNLSISSDKISSRDIRRLNKTISAIDTEIVLSSDLSEEEKSKLLLKLNWILEKLNAFHNNFLKTKQANINVTRWVLKDLIWDLESNDSNREFSANEAFNELKKTNIYNQNMRSTETSDYKNLEYVVNNLSSYKDKPYFDELVENILLKNSFLLYDVFWELEWTKFFTEENLIKIIINDWRHSNIDNLVSTLRNFSKEYKFDSLLVKYFITTGDLFLERFVYYENILSDEEIKTILYWIDWDIIFWFYSNNLKIYFDYFKDDLESPYFKSFLMKALKNMKTLDWEGNGNWLLDNFDLLSWLSYFKEIIFLLIDNHLDYAYSYNFLLELYHNDNTNIFFNEFIIKLYNKDKDGFYWKLLIEWWEWYDKFDLNIEKEAKVLYKILVLEFSEKYNIKNIIKEWKLEEFYSEYMKIVKNNSSILRWGRRVMLWNNYEKQLKNFFKEWEFEKFVWSVLITESSNISQWINDIYDYNDEDEASHEVIVSELNKWIKKYSTEELISSLWNHSINYSTTFNLILNEIENRSVYNNIYELISKNENIDNKTKDFLIWQVIIWLSSRWKIDKLNNFINNIWDNSKVESIIVKIIDYKNSEIFNLTSYSWLLVWLVRLLEKNNFIKDIILKIFKWNNHKNFNNWLITSLLLKDKENLVIYFIWSDYKNTEYYNKYKESIKYSSFNQEIFTKKQNDIVMIYGWEWEWWGLERYKSEIRKFISLYKYNIIKSSEEFTILEKKGIRISFVNYDLVWWENINNILTNEWIDANLVMYRGHNYYTSEMILKTKWYNKKAAIIDGWCRNVSMIDKYISSDIDNQIIAYDSTWIWNETLNLLTSYIKMIRDVKSWNKKQSQFSTWANLKDSINSSYIKEHMVFPGSLVDIILRIEKEN